MNRIYVVDVLYLRHTNEELSAFSFPLSQVLIMPLSQLDCFDYCNRACDIWLVGVGVGLVWFNSFYIRVSINTVGQSPWWSPIQVLTEVNVP